MDGDPEHLIWKLDQSWVSTPPPPPRPPSSPSFIYSQNIWDKLQF